MKYVLVQWSSGNIKTSILTENYVRDKSMLYDCTKEGIISFVTVQRGDTSVVKTKGKLGRIACVSDDRKLVEEHQNLLLAEESEFIDDTESMTPPRSKSLKRPRYEIENGILDEQESSYVNDLSSVAGLKQRISKLVEELSEEKLKVKELQKLDETLQKKLPELLRNAIQSSEALTELRTCPNCKQSHRTCRSTEASEPPTPSNMMVMKTLPPISSEPSTSNSSENFETASRPNGIFSPQPISYMPVVTSVTSILNTNTDVEKGISTYQPSPELPPHMPMAPYITSRLNTPNHLVNGSPERPSLAVTLPGMSSMTSEAGNTSHEVLSPESIKSRPVSAGQEDNQNMSSEKHDASTSDKAPVVQSLPIEVTYATTYRKMTLAFMTHLFDKEVLKVSSVTGAGKSGRPALDKHIVQYIIDYVQKRFPNVKPRTIKATMAQKCKYARLPRKKNNKPDMDVED